MSVAVSVTQPRYHELARYGMGSGSADQRAVNTQRGGKGREVMTPSSGLLAVA